MPEAIIEIYSLNEQGYHPFLIRDGWQVAKLNYQPKQDFLNIEKMDMHLLTDEVFILLKGIAILIAALEENNDFKFECVKMQPGVAYNIPVNQWHNIAMDKVAELFIVEKSNTHVGDYKFKKLDSNQKKQLNSLIKELLE